MIGGATFSPEFSSLRRGFPPQHLRRLTIKFLVRGLVSELDRAAIFHTRELMRSLKPVVLLLCLLVIPATADSQARITSPRAQFGHDIGDAYFPRQLHPDDRYGTSSIVSRSNEDGPDRDVGRGAPDVDGLSSRRRENHARLQRYQEISRRLALAGNLTTPRRVSLATEGRAVVWIDGGLHATEVLGAQQLIQTVYEWSAAPTPRRLRFLRDDINPLRARES